MPFFSGKGSTPGTVRAWLKHMKLAILQLQPEDHVLYAINFLRGVAPDWRNPVMEKAFPGLLNIPWDTSERALLKRFVPAVTCMEALKNFETIHQTGSVEEYAHFLMRAEELINLPHVKAPDETSQIRTYMRGL